MHPKFPEVYAELSRGMLSPQSAGAAFSAILSGAWTPIQVGAFIASLRLRGESAGVIAAAATAMRAAMVRVEHEFDVVVDTCGTGGDGSGTLNLSTGAAVLVAACGLVVAKHGNRAMSSRSGSADVLEALGIPVDLPASAGRAILEEANIAFLLAPTHHPAMRHATQARKELGIRTLFNCLGPLANPAGATHQLVGAYDDAVRPIMADTLRLLGTRRAWVVCGDGGLDEVSPWGKTRVTQLSSGTLTELEIEPSDFGVEPCPREAVRGGDAAYNAGVLETVLRGEPHPSSSAFVLNAAATLVVAEDMEPRAAAERARGALASGAAYRVLEAFRKAARARKSTGE